jgi:hypothetical protein
MIRSTVPVLLLLLVNQTNPGMAGSDGSTQRQAETEINRLRGMFQSGIATLSDPSPSHRRSHRDRR